MSNPTSPSFSPARKWSTSLSVLLSVAALLAVVLMVNYLAARHYWRLPLSFKARTELSSLTQRVLAGVTNEVKVTVYFDKQGGLFDAVWGLLKEYKFANDKIAIEAVDYVSDPTAAQLVKAKYKLTTPTDKNLVIFDCPGHAPRIIYESELSTLDLQPLMSGKSQEVRRTHFKGELMFTSALQSVTSSRALKAYYLQGHGEHRLDSDDKVMGYSKFAGMLKDNNVQVESLDLRRAGEVPSDGHLLIIAGPTDPLLPEELDKIDRYLKQGGRLLALFNFFSAEKQLGLEKILANWGVEVGNNVVLDQESGNTLTGKDIVVSQFGSHPLIRPFHQSRRLFLVLPRSVGKAPNASTGADAPQVEELAWTSAQGRKVTDIRQGELHPRAGDTVEAVPLMVAVEKGGVRGVSADRGATRLVVVGESIFLGNQTSDQLANREFASHAINWLLARDELLPGLEPRPIKEYTLTITQSQMTALRWELLLGMPGAVLVLGGLVWLRRRH